VQNPPNADAITLVKKWSLLRVEKISTVFVCGADVLLKLHAIRAPKRQNIDFVA